MSIEERIDQLSKYAHEFHAHLDVCKQCEQHPFALCPVGHRLINLAGGHDPKHFPEPEQRDEKGIL